MSLKKKILIIEDEKDLSALMKDILEDTGRYEVRTAGDGRTGLDLCRRYGPDLVFLDFVMPGMKGNEVLEQIRKMRPAGKIPIVIMSGLNKRVYFQQNGLSKTFFDQTSGDWDMPGQKDAGVNGSGKKEKKWSGAPDDIVEMYGVVAYLPKPFTRAGLLDVAGTVLGNAGV